MTSADSKTVLGWLKAAGEDSRLRLLGLCAQQEMSVSDLAEALRQSETRVSRHLKILCEAGLLERLRQGQWVPFRKRAPYWIWHPQTPDHRPLLIQKIE